MTAAAISYAHPLHGSAPSRDEAAAVQIAAVRSQLENRFREAGATLADVLQMVERLIASVDGLARTMETDLIERTTGELLASASQLSALSDNQADRMSRLAQVHEVTTSLMSHIEGMRQTMGFIRVFAINIKITAAGSMEFTGYAAEMLERIEYGSQQLDDFTMEVERVASEITAAITTEQDLERQSTTLLPRVTRELAADAQGLKDHHKRVMAATREVASLAQNIQGKVGRTLAALQIGDITRQRLEHVESALSVITTLEQDGAIHFEATRGAIRKLMAAQMADTLAEFTVETQMVSTNLGDMAADTDQILRLRDRSFGASARSGGGFVGALEASVAVAHKLVSRVENANSDASAIAAATSDAASSLVPRVGGLKSVKTEIQHMAVNTSLRSSRMGPAGRPLTVIASEMRSEATALDYVASRTIESIEQLAVRAANLETVETVSDSGAALEQAMRQIRTIGDNVERQMPLVAIQGQEVSAALARASGLINFHESLIRWDPLESTCRHASLSIL